MGGGTQGEPIAKGPTVKPTLKDLHAELCSEGFHYNGEPILDCGADEDNPAESGVCGIWDALRDAYAAGKRGTSSSGRGGR